MQLMHFFTLMFMNITCRAAAVCTVISVCIYACVCILAGFYDRDQYYSLEEECFLIACIYCLKLRAKCIIKKKKKKAHFSPDDITHLLLLLHLQILNYLFHYLFVLPNIQNPYLQRGFNHIQILSKKTCNILAIFPFAGQQILLMTSELRLLFKAKQWDNFNFVNILKQVNKEVRFLRTEHENIILEYSAYPLSKDEYRHYDCLASFEIE